MSMTPVTVPLLAQTTPDTFWLPEGASTFAPLHDGLFYFIYWLCVIFFVGIMATAALFVMKYRRQRAGQRTSGVAGNHALEVAWSVIPAVLLLVIFGWSFIGYRELVTVPSNALDIRVTGQKWSWSFQYPDGTVATDLVVPIDTPVRLTMSSTDVIHSFFVPAFRIKRDVIPNRYTVQWFEATAEGEYQVFCTEYCGTNHSQMLATVRVVSESGYQDWLRSASGPPEGLTPAQWGEQLFSSNGCNACHATTDQRIVGPGLGNLWGTEVAREGGGTATFDDNLVRQAMMEPGASVAAGFPPVMPTFAGRLTDLQVNALIDYIRSLTPGQ